MNNMILPDLTDYGWKNIDGKLECDWDSEENFTAVRNRVSLLFKGCSCSSANSCVTCRCSCVKRNSKCGPGCRCKNCGNIGNVLSGSGEPQAAELDRGRAGA